jgi:hypothetical protein
MNTNTSFSAHKRPSFKVKRALQWVLTGVVVTMLQACVSTTPVLDAQFGSALTQAKAAQSLPPSEPIGADQQGAGLPSATESLRGLGVHNTGRSAPSALTAK